MIGFATHEALIDIAAFLHLPQFFLFLLSSMLHQHWVLACPWKPATNTWFRLLAWSMVLDYAYRAFYGALYLLPNCGAPLKINRSWQLICQITYDCWRLIQLPFLLWRRYNAIAEYTSIAGHTLMLVHTVSHNNVIETSYPIVTAFGVLLKHYFRFFVFSQVRRAVIWWSHFCSCQFHL